MRHLVILHDKYLTLQGRLRDAKIRSAQIKDLTAENQILKEELENEGSPIGQMQALKAENKALRDQVGRMELSKKESENFDSVERDSQDRSEDVDRPTEQPEISEIDEQTSQEQLRDAAISVERTHILKDEDQKSQEQLRDTTTPPEGIQSLENEIQTLQQQLKDNDTLALQNENLQNHRQELLRDREISTRQKQSLEDEKLKLEEQVKGINILREQISDLQHGKRQSDLELHNMDLLNEQVQILHRERETSIDIIRALEAELVRAKQELEETRSAVKSKDLSLEQYEATSATNLSHAEAQSKQRVEAMQAELDVIKEQNRQLATAYKRAARSNTVFHKMAFVGRKNLWLIARVRNFGDDSGSLQQTIDKELLMKYETRPGRQNGTTLRIAKDDKAHTFAFDKVLADRRAIREELEMMTQTIIEGHNLCLIVDGRSGTGKTYVTFTSDDAIAGQIVLRLFEWRDTSIAQGGRCTIDLTAFEVLSGAVYDLLIPSPEKKEGKRESLNVHSFSAAVEISDLTRMSPQNAKEMQYALLAACHNRTTSATEMNETSSRGHMVATILISACHDGSTMQEWQVSFVNLVGSEKPEEPLRRDTPGINLARSDLYTALKKFDKTQDTSGSKSIITLFQRPSCSLPANERIQVGPRLTQ